MGRLVLGVPNNNEKNNPYFVLLGDFNLYFVDSLVKAV